nr:FecR domain-containing protein [Roseivirga sp. E12]
MQGTPEPSIYSTDLADNITHTLPDNSMVTINAQSSISLIEENWGKSRSLRLNGEAFFEVEPGSKFTVTTNLGEISVLGTSFNIFSRDDELIVSTFTGKVEVKDKDRLVILEKGDQLTYRPTEELWRIDNFNLNETATWRTGAFYFDTTPLQKVIDELERQFDIKINVSIDLRDRFYSGYFSKTDLTEALQLVFVPMGLTIEVEGNQVNVQ